MQPQNEAGLYNAAKNRPGEFARHQVSRMILYAMTWLVAIAWADAMRRSIEYYLPGKEKVAGAWAFAGVATVVVIVATISIGKMGVVRQV